jgi:hypothetical protein
MPVSLSYLLEDRATGMLPAIWGVYSIACDFPYSVAGILILPRRTAGCVFKTRVSAHNLDAG